MSNYINLPAASTINNINVDNLNDGSKEFNKMVQRASHLQPEASRKMYEYGMMKQVAKSNLVNKVQQIQTNPILQQAMKQNYLQFAAQVHQYIQQSSSSFTGSTQLQTKPPAPLQLTFNR